MPSQLAKVNVLAPATYKEKYITIEALVQSTIVLTPEKYPPRNLLDHAVDKLQGIEGYEKIRTTNFQHQLGGNVDILIGEDLRDLHPISVGEIHDGFEVVRHRARLYNPDQFLGFVGVFPTGMEPILKIESHSIALHYEDHHQQEEHETESVFPETASVLQSR